MNPCLMRRRGFFAGQFLPGKYCRAGQKMPPDFIFSGNFFRLFG